MAVVNILWLVIIFIHISIIFLMRIDRKVKVIMGIISSISLAVVYSRYSGNPAAVYLMFILPVFYLILAGNYNVKKEKRLFSGIGSKLRYSKKVERAEYEMASNIFHRCVVTWTKDRYVKGRFILILPQMPFAHYTVDYDGNCMNALGRYDEIGRLYNFAPYNELADSLAQSGYLVMRMDMAGGQGNEKITDYKGGVLDWVAYIKQLFGMEDEPIVIGHRENGIHAVRLMAEEKWKTGILLCCGSGCQYREEGKSCFDYMLELREENSILQIEAGIGKRKKNRKETVDKLKCRYKSVKIENMNVTLREGKSRNISEKGYGISCGTGSFPPIHEELAGEIVEYLNHVQAFRMERV